MVKINDKAFKTLRFILLSFAVSLMTLSSLLFNFAPNNLSTNYFKLVSLYSDPNRDLAWKPNFDHRYTRVDFSLNPQIQIHKTDNYFIVPNFVKANKSYHGNESITLTTQGTPAFLFNLVPVCRRWRGPLSVSVYADGDAGLHRAFKIISYLKMCGYPCIKSYVTFHLILSDDTALDSLARNLPWSQQDGRSYFCREVSVKQLFENTIKEEETSNSGRGYPINLARNVARSLARTFFILASDIELYPSLNIIPRFLRLMASGDIPQDEGRQVYALPVFEVEKDEKPPKHKADMVKSLNSGRAVLFHYDLCKDCQDFPERDSWLLNLPHTDSLAIHSKGRRSRQRWEPIYIGTNAEPYYDEELTWEGFKDKLSQMYEMCLMNYVINVLDNAFLVHAPGIKQQLDPNSAKYRIPFSTRNEAIYWRSIQRLKTKYSDKHADC